MNEAILQSSRPLPFWVAIPEEHETVSYHNF